MYLSIPCIFLIIFLVDISATSNKRCTLPKHPKNGQWSISSMTKSPGDKVSSGTIINVRCNGQYAFDGPSIIECENGKWKSNIGKCLKLCPPIIPKSSTIVTCTIDGKDNKDCMNVKNGTIASFACAPFYENAELNRNPFRLCSNGKWNQEIPVCTPVCGSKPKPLKKGDKIYYPWNAVIYRKKGKEFIYCCTGTLINERTILTVAHWLTDYIGTKKLPSDYSVAVGKFTKKYHDHQDTASQYSDVEDMFIPSKFKGSIRRFIGNIAVIITKKSFIMNEQVQPACLDWSNTYEEYFEEPDQNSLSVAGPLVTEYYPFLKNFTKVPIKLVNETQCYFQLSPNASYLHFEAYYAPVEMYCSEYIDERNVRMCIVDQGVGLITENRYNKKYYVIGVLAVSPSIHGESCQNKKWTLYTKTSQYISFINEKVNLYAPIPRRYFQISCGIKSVKAQTLIVNGRNVTKGDYPWQVAIYKIADQQRILICGGSLLNQRVVLTAAHCVTDVDGTTLNTELFAVAVGKYYRNFNDPRDEQAQFSSVKQIFTPSYYKGDIQNYRGDIAILITETSFILSKQVQPVCVDWDAKYENQFLKPNSTGYVTGWGYTKQNQQPSEELKDLEVPNVEQNVCQKHLPPDYEIYLTSDKLCAGFLDGGKSVCNGDSGGGLVFKNNNDDRYYIAGVVSLAPQAPIGGCNSQQYGLYTRVSTYVKKFISKKVRLYWA